jgi:hypothetical protein
MSQARSISERATARISALPADQRPLSEQYRIAAKQWVELDAAARLLEETKTAVLAERKTALGDMPDSRAERIVRASPRWAEFVKTMVDARTAANLARVKMKWLEICIGEWTSADANQRAERRHAGTAP